MLSTREQTARADVPHPAVEEQGPTPSPRSRRSAASVFVLLAAVSVGAMTAGAIRPGLATAFAVGFGWLLWRYLPAVGDRLLDASDADAWNDDPFPREES